MVLVPLHMFFWTMWLNLSEDVAFIMGVIVRPLDKSHIGKTRERR